MKEEIKKTEVLVLKVTDYRETSRIINGFSEDFGKITLLAKGARKPKSRISAPFQTLVNSEVVFYKKENRDMYIVKEAGVVEYFQYIHSNLVRFNYASVVADFIFSFLAPEQVSKTLFQYSLHILKEINVRPVEVLPGIITKFLLKGSAILGFKMELSKCSSCGNRIEPPVYISSESGGVICNKCYQKYREAISIDYGTYKVITQIEKVAGKQMIIIGKKELKEILLIFSNWFFYHNHRALKTLGNLIESECSNTMEKAGLKQ